MTRGELVFERPQLLDATEPPERRGLARDDVRLLVSTPRGHEHAHFRELPMFLAPGTVLVVNRSATLPASLPAHAHFGAFTLNLSTRYGPDLWLAEPRWNPATPGPLPLVVGDAVVVADLRGRIIAPYPGLPRLWFVRIEGDVAAAMARHGAPIRYAYLEPPYPDLDAYQTVFATAPGSAEMPSAARPFSLRVLDDVRAAGIHIATISLHTGVASLDVEAEVVAEQVLYPEPFSVDAGAARMVNDARADGRAVVAVGTSVVRALESAFDGTRVRAARGFTRLFLHAARRSRVVAGLITGLHDSLASHLALLHAVADPELIRDAYAEAIREQYLWHEFGDSHLILPRAA